MWQVTAVVIGGLSFTTIVLIAWGLFGRADDTRPTCVRCRGDVRRFAWAEPPVCECGARLDRPGAVRPSGRARRRRILFSATLPAAAALVILFTAGWLDRRRLQWPDLVPLAIVRASVEGGSEWAAESILRRYYAGRIDDAWILGLADRPAGSSPAISPTLATLLNPVLERQWPRLIAVDGAGILPAEREGLAIFRITSPVSVVAADPSADGAMAVMLYGFGASTFGRVEAVRVDGVPVRWRLVAVGPPGRVGRRVAVGPCRIEVLGPSDPTRPLTVAQGVRRIEVDLLLVVSAAAPAAMGDPVVDPESDADPTEPETWGIDGRSMMLRLETTLSEPTRTSDVDSKP